MKGMLKTILWFVTAMGCIFIENITGITVSPGQGITTVVSFVIFTVFLIHS